MNLRGSSFVVGIMMLFATEADARTWHIKPDGSGDAPTIQAGIDSAAATGDTVLISDGYYHETLNAASKDIALVGSGAKRTTVDADYNDSVLKMGIGQVEGLTLTKGLAFIGGGISLFSSQPGHTTIRQCTIRDNLAQVDSKASLGGGIASGGLALTVTIDRCVIVDNSAAAGGGGIYAANMVAVLGCVVAHNRTFSPGAGILAGVLAPVVLRGSLIFANVSETSAPGMFLQNATCVGNTIAGNSGGLESTEIADASTIANNIFYSEEGLVGVSSTISCNDFFESGPIGGDGNVILDNIFVDPEFCAVDPVRSGSFVLQSDSPCMTAASCTQIGAETVGCGTVTVAGRTWSQIKRMYR